MKKIFFTLICLFIFPLGILAIEYNVPELGIKIDFPEKYVVFTRDNIKNNEYLEESGITEEYMENMFNNYNVYLDAYVEERLSDFLISSQISSIQTLDGYNEAQIELLKAQIQDEYRTKFNYELDNIYTETINDQLYFISEYQIGDWYVLSYFTAMDYKAYNFQIQSPSKIDTEYRKEISQIMATVEINPDEAITTPNETDNEDNGDSKKGYYVTVSISIPAICIILVLVIIYKISTKKRKEKN